jgi:hypothetical protein
VTLIGTATRPSDGADPRRTQKRIAVSGSGRTIAVDITGDDRLRLIRQLPSRWPEVIMARERGDTLEEIHRWARCPLTPALECHGRCDPACLRCGIAACYAWLETELHELAGRRGRLLP